MQPIWAESPVFRQQIFLVNNYFGSFVTRMECTWDMHSVAAGDTRARL